MHRNATTNIEAYETWLRARSVLGRGTRDAAAEARALHSRAIELDPRFAAPHAGLALCALADYVSGWASDPARALDEADRWARRAVELDDQEPVSHMALGNVLIWRRDIDGAIAEFERMLALDPNHAQAHASMGLALVYAGRAAEALECFARSVRLDPRHAPIVLHFRAQAHFSLGDDEAAAALLRERIARDPGTDASRMLLAACYGHLGRADDARTVWAELLDAHPAFSLAQRQRVLPYANPADLERIADGLRKAGLP